ncbi:DAK2 domain-containing protein [Nocardiopsis mangrovi]|uniref:DAK2 domain-containing protein n=1 Tax=Nocardiopsis mangrovi TaxID=1179818 RepID=A0ABV9DTP7_9ACTN
MNGDGFRAWVLAALPGVAGHVEEFTELDSAAGDGDLGITLRSGTAAVDAALRGLAEGTPIAVVCRTAGKAFAAGNPSSFAALGGAGLLAAARTLADVPDADRGAAAAALRSALAVIMERGGAAPGERTVVDALLPSVEVLERQGGGPAAPLPAMVAAAEEATAATAHMVPRRGRAAWTGDRGAGVPDAGATVWLRTLQAFAATDAQRR